MKTELSILKVYWKYILFVVLAIGIAGCSGDDDDGGNPDPDDDPTGSITASDQVASQNTIIVESVSVGQDSWLVARNSGEDGDPAIISDAVMIEEGTEEDVEVTLNESANLGGEEGDEIVLMLHVDDPEDGSFGYVDDQDEDEYIMSNGSRVSETITVTSPTFDIEDQDVEENSVTFTSVSGFGGSWITLHDQNEDGTVNEDVIVGQAYVPAGTTDPVTVDFNEDFTYTPGQTLYPRLYTDNPADEEFTYWDDNTTDVPEIYGYDSTTGDPLYVGGTSNTGIVVN